MSIQRLPSRQRTGLFMSFMLLLGAGAFNTVSAEPAQIATPVEQTPSSRVDGEYGVLRVEGELVDSPCRLALDSRDQTVDLGILAAATLAHPGARSLPFPFTIRLQDCLVASGSSRDPRTDTLIQDSSRPVVNISLIALPDSNETELVALRGTEGLALRITDSQQRVIVPGAPGLPQFLTPGDNVLTWNIAAERTSATLKPGPFYAVADFRLSYE